MTDNEAANKASNILAGLIMMSLKCDMILSELKAKAGAAGNDLDPVEIPETMYLIGASQALKAALECIDDPMAGVNALESDVSEIRFKAQVLMMERGK